MTVRTHIRVIALAATMGTAVGAQALTFNFIPVGTLPAGVIAGFNAAGATWSAIFNDPVTINIQIGYSALGGNVLGQTSDSQQVNSYADVRSALIADSKSAVDATAVAHLQAGPNLSIETNRFSNNPHGSGSLTPYVTSVSFMALSTANAKALGLFAGNNAAQDASITFNSNVNWSFNHSSVGASQFDFVGVATHEIAHALGFLSGVDYVDSQNGDTDTTFAWAEPLDLYRFKNGINLPYLAADTSAKYFSVDSGATGVADGFSTGVNNGDGNQASHWKHQIPNIGIMDPIADPGTINNPTMNDINALDAIGWDRAAVPEPTSMAALGIGVFSLLAARRRRKR